jgi:hypothetical protein
VRGRARGSSFRLQKSTSGAWLMPIGPRVKSPRTRSGSSPQRESSGGEGAPEAGSRAVSLRDRWRVRSVCESGHSRALVDGRRPGPGTPPSLTRRRQKRSWCFAEVRLVPGRGGARNGASEVLSPTLRTADNAVAMGVPSGRRRPVPSSSAQDATRRGLRAMEPKLGAAPSSVGSPGAGSSKGGTASLAPLLGSGPARVACGEVHCGWSSRREPQSSGIGRSTGVRALASVAEVGEKHLLRSTEGSREANRGEAAKRGRAVPNP